MPTYNQNNEQVNGLNMTMYKTNSKVTNDISELDDQSTANHCLVICQAFFVKYKRSTKYSVDKNGKKPCPWI